MSFCVMMVMRMMCIRLEVHVPPLVISVITGIRDSFSGGMMFELCSWTSPWQRGSAACGQLYSMSHSSLLLQLGCQGVQTGWGGGAVGVAEAHMISQRDGLTKADRWCD